MIQRRCDCCNRIKIEEDIDIPIIPWQSLAISYAGVPTMFMSDICPACLDYIKNSIQEVIKQRWTEEERKNEKL